nr:uncharacterized protein LOC116768483 [Danaus plexippus plexippus]
MADMADMIQADLHKSYATVLKYFMLTGINLFDDKNIFISKFNNLYIFSFILYLTVSISHVIYSVRQFLGGVDFLETIIDLSFCCNCVQGIIMYIYMCVIKHRIKDFVMDIDKQWRDDSSLKPRVAMYKRNELKKLNFTSNYLHVYMCYPITKILVKKYIFNKTVPYHSPFHFWVPFEYKDNILKFIALYFVDYLMVSILAHTINCSLLVLTVSIKQLNILFVLLQEDFKDIIELKEEGMNIKLKRAIQRHSILNRLVVKIGNTYGILFAIHIIFTSATVCFYSVTAKIYGRREDFKNLIISILTFSNVFYCCAQGQFLNDEAENVANVIYENSWEDQSIENRKLLLLIILR